MDANLYALERLAEARLADARAWRQHRALLASLEAGREPARAAGLAVSRWRRRLAQWLAGTPSGGSTRTATRSGAA